MNGTKTGSRILIYSHDTFGLGHLRRCHTIAQSLVEHFHDLSVLILSGSPIIGSFDFPSHVDFVRVPGVIKLRNGEYISRTLEMNVEETISIRSSIIQHTASIFEPDVFIVDKEPLGLRGEVAGTLTLLKDMGTRLVLGLRDVLDEPAALAPEWERKKVLPALENLYDEIWIYGLPQICEPLDGIDLPPEVLQKIVYTGYLPRRVKSVPASQKLPDIVKKPYLLVTPGGGGDGQGLIEWVLRAYESDELLPYPALLVLGPFMAPEVQADFMARAARLNRVEAITFDAHMESLEANAAGIVAMGGYNTFCEVLSLDKRALIVPRTVPRLEQYIRASRAQDLGLVRMLVDDGTHDPRPMIDALRALPQQRHPSEVVVPGLFEGLRNVNRLVEPCLRRPRAEEPAANIVPHRA